MIGGGLVGCDLAVADKADDQPIPKRARRAKELDMTMVKKIADDVGINPDRGPGARNMSHKFPRRRRQKSGVGLCAASS
jgi:hypothetical protein